MAVMETALSLHNTLASIAATTAAPDWIQLLPAGTFVGGDGRGPYVAENPEAIIAASFGGLSKLPLDENHSTDVALRGDATPARGWIVEMQAREDGVWGRVEWTNEGRRLVEDREYGFISPVILHSEEKPHRISRILRASLVNDPNFHMKSLHKKEIAMEKELRELLGLDDKADVKSIMSSLRERLAAGTASTEAIANVAKSLNLKEGAKTDEVITSLNSRLTTKPEPVKEDEGEVASLREEVKSLNTKLAETVSVHAKERAENVITQAIEDGKVVPALRDHYITRHMRNPQEVEDELKVMPSLHSGGLGNGPAIETEAGALDASDAEVCSMMGLDPEEFAKQAKETRKVLS